MVVPTALRPLIEKSELTLALGPDRQAGMDEHYKAVAEFKPILSDANRKHAAGAEILPYKPRPNARRAAARHDCRVVSHPRSAAWQSDRAAGAQHANPSVLLAA